MACTNCGSSVQGQCDVCLLVDGDESFKLIVWCEDCGAYICKACEEKRMKRAMAATIDLANKILIYFNLKSPK